MKLFTESVVRVGDSRERAARPGKEYMRCKICGAATKPIKIRDGVYVPCFKCYLEMENAKDVPISRP